jgi:hypothetical protein
MGLISVQCLIGGSVTRKDFSTYTKIICLESHLVVNQRIPDDIVDWTFDTGFTPGIYPFHSCFKADLERSNNGHNPDVLIG